MKQYTVTLLHNNTDINVITVSANNKADAIYKARLAIAQLQGFTRVVSVVGVK